MGLTVNAVWNRLVSSGLTDAAACRDLAIAYSRAHEGSPPTEPRQLARWLVKTQRLTEYQARLLLGTSDPRLKIGSLILRDVIDRWPFNGWLEGSDADGQPAWLAPLQRGDPAPGSDPASLRRLQRHAAVRHPHLQPLEGPVRHGETTYLVTRLPPGRLLSEAISAGKPTSSRRVVQIGIQLAEALSALHAAALVHGAVHPQRVWLTPGGDAVLLRNPFGAEVPAELERPSCFSPLETPELYAAPEFTVPGKQPDAASDLYALGCLLCHLRFGEPPMGSGDSAEVARRHAREFPEPIREAVAAGAGGDPLLRVLAHAIAKNADARFADAPALAAALSASGQEPTAAAAPSPPLAPAAAPSPAAPAPSAPPVPKPTAETTAKPPAKAETKRPAKSAAEPAATPVPKAPAKPSPKAGAVAAKPVAPVAKEAAEPTQKSPAPALAIATPAGTAATTVRRRRKKKASKRGPLILGGLGFGVMVLLVLVLAPGDRDGRPTAVREPAPPIPSGPAATTPSVDRPRDATAATGSTAAPERVRLVDDPGLLWAAPTRAADAPPLEMLPPGPQMIVMLRPQRLLESAAGAQLRSALAVDLEAALAALEARLAMPLASVTRLTIALEGGDDGWPTAAWVAELAEPQSLDELLDRWDAAPARSAEGTTVYAGDDPEGDVYYVGEPSGELVERFAVGSAAQMQAVADNQGAAIPLPRQLQQLWSTSASDADLVAMVSPNFLFADGRRMLDQFAPGLVDPLRELLVPEAGGALVSMVLEPKWFTEIRLAPGADASPGSLATRLKQTLEELPEAAERFLLESQPHPSWRPLAVRMPGMYRALAESVRAGVSQGHAAANFYLPSAAAPNVLLSGWLAANTPAGASAATPAALAQASSSPNGGAATEPMALDQLLDRPMSVQFDQESLEFAAETIADEFNRTLRGESSPLRIRLIGGDLQKEGITQNQQIRDFQHQGAPLRAVLTDLVMRGNPVTTVTDASQEDQKLVWVVGDDPEASGGQAILITTRTSAAGRYELPAEFSR